MKHCYQLFLVKTHICNYFRARHTFHRSTTNYKLLFQKPLIECPPTCLLDLSKIQQKRSISFSCIWKICFCLVIMCRTEFTGNANAFIQHHHSNGPISDPLAISFAPADNRRLSRAISRMKDLRSRDPAIWDRALFPEHTERGQGPSDGSAGHMSLGSQEIQGNSKQLGPAHPIVQLN